MPRSTLVKDASCSRVSQTRAALVELDGVDLAVLRNPELRMETPAPGQPCVEERGPVAVLDDEGGERHTVLGVAGVVHVGEMHAASIAVGPVLG